MTPKLKWNANKHQGKVLGCSLALLLLTGCSGTPSAAQNGVLPPNDTLDVRAEAAPVATLPAPVNSGGNPDTQPIGPWVSPDSQPAVVPGVTFTKVTCGTATMDVPTNLTQVSQYGDKDITTEYASADGKTKLELTCRDRKATDDPNTDFQNTFNSLTKSPDYVYNKNNTWVITGPGLLCAGNCPGSDTSEYYTANWYSNSKVFSMLWEYPNSQHDNISPTIAHVYYSFKWNGGTASPAAPGQTQQPIAPVAPGQTQQPMAPISPGQTQQPVTPTPTYPTAKTTIQLALREGPDCGSARLAWIPKGTSVNIERAAIGDQAGWYMVTYQGKTGWASGYYLDGDTITYDGAKLCEN